MSLLAIIVALGLYSNTFIVTETVTETDTVVCTDLNGNQFSFTSIEDWQKGDIISAIMCNNGTTETIYDDYFVSVTYSGYIQ